MGASSPRARTLTTFWRTFVGGARGEAAGGGDVVVLVLRQVVLDLLDQREAGGEGPRCRGGGGLREKAAGAAQPRRRGLQRREVEVGVAERRPGQHVVLKVE